MNARCCTPPNGSRGESLASCRHRLFANDDEEYDDGPAVLDKSITIRPSESYQRCSASLAPEDDCFGNMAEPSAHRFASVGHTSYSPRPSFPALSLAPPHLDYGGRCAFQGLLGDPTVTTPWKSSGDASHGPSTAVLLQTPEIQRGSLGSAAASTMLPHLLFTPQVSTACLSMRATLDHELDSINAENSVDSLPPVTMVVENEVYVGGFPDAETVPILLSLGIHHIINCCANDIDLSPAVRHHFEVHELFSVDRDDYLILYHDYESFARIVSRLLANGESVFVHCVAGVNRSITLCAAYLMDRYLLTPVEAMRVFRVNGRMRILDSRSFRHQLIDHYFQSVAPQDV